MNDSEGGGCFDWNRNGFPNWMTTISGTMLPAAHRFNGRNITTLGVDCTLYGAMKTEIVRLLPRSPVYCMRNT